ncbi:MPN570 family protein [Mycoplasmoides genitalium]
MKQKILGITIAFIILLLTTVAILFSVKVKQYLNVNLWTTQQQNFLMFKNEKDENLFNNVSWTNFQAETTEKSAKKAFRLYKKKISTSEISSELNKNLVKIDLSVTLEQGWYNITIMLPSKDLFEVIF